jgi:thiamine biosynthesis lipoprotein
MGMPVIIQVVDDAITESDFEEVFSFLHYVDQKFSTYKLHSEITKINQGEILPGNYSDDMKFVLAESEKTKKETNGYFDISHNGKIDPSGLVKGWAIYNAAKILSSKGFTNYFVEISGDIEMSGYSSDEKKWKIGIRNPFKHDQIIKVLYLTNCGVATSGTYEQGQHVYDPKKPDKPLEEIVSITVIGPNIFDADRYATAAFAMQKEGILFLERLSGFEGYMIDKDGIATFTSNFEKYITK